MKLLRNVAAIALTAAATGCLGSPTPRRPADRPGELTQKTEATTLSATKPALDGKRLAEFGLDVYWDSQIRGESIARMQLEGNSLYVITDSYRIYQVDCHSGKVNWVYDVGRPIQFLDRERPIAEYVYPKSEDGLDRYDEVYFCSKDTLYALDKKGGADLWRLNLSFGAASPPQPSATHVLIGSWDTWVYAIKKSSQPVTWDWKWRTNGDVVTRAAVDGAFIFVCSSDGQLYTFETARGEIQGDTFKTERAITADPLVHRKLIYLGGEDMNLYVLNVDGGQLEYRLPAGAPIKKRPVAIGNDVYVATERMPGDKPEDPQYGVIALAKKGRDVNFKKTQFEQHWLRPKAERVLARGKESVYLLEPSTEREGVAGHRITKIDAKDGFFRDEIKADDVGFFVTNAFDPNQKPTTTETLMGGIVFLGYRNGWIIALKERSEF